MGQFVQFSSGDSRNLHIVVTRRRDEQYLMGCRIDNCHNIYIAPAVCLDRAVYVDTADIYGKRIVFYFYLLGSIIFHFCLNGMRIDHFNTVAEITELFT